MKRFLTALPFIALALLPLLAYAENENAKQDDNYVSTQLGVAKTSGERRNIRTNEDGELLVEVSSGTVSSLPPGVSGKTYTYRSSTFTATGSLSFTGYAWSWLVESFGGGQVEFDIDGGDTQVLRSGFAAGGEFRFMAVNPTVNITSLPSGATAQVKIEGVN